MNKKEVLKLIGKGENHKVEFKSSLELKDEIGEHVSAFATNCDGIILIGVKDSGEVQGVKIGKKTLESLANHIKQNTDNPVYPKMSVKRLNSKDVIVVEVKESDEKPVFFKGKAYKRVGKSIHKLSASEIRQTAKESTGGCWDKMVCEGAGLKDIDLRFVKREFIPLYERVSKKKVAGKAVDLLKTLGCIKNNKPTNAGILLFGKNPQKFFGNAYIALARYKGREVYVERLDYKEFTGNLFEQIDKCNDYIVEHTTLMSRLTPGKVRRTDIPEYGRFSMRELITNAVCHRDYEEQGSKIIIKVLEDKIEFYNIGGLPKGITPKNITSKQFSRNRTISKVLAKVEYIEELGEGWNKIIKEHKNHPLNPVLPKIDADKFSTLITLFSTKEKFEEEKEEVELSERQRKIVKYLKENKKITRSTCMKLLDVSKDTAVRELSNLKSKNIIKRKGVGRGIYYVIK